MCVQKSNKNVKRLCKNDYGWNLSICACQTDEYLKKSTYMKSQING